MANVCFVPRGRELGAFLDRRPIGAVKVKRWDGMSNTSGEWDCLRRDPELWFPDGNCLVHLYAKGQSKRGPSFRVAFSALLEADCLPLIARFLPRDGSRPRSPREVRKLEPVDPKHPIELYIAAAPLATKEQVFRYHIATRNLFAWVFRQPLVGIHLGQALIGLLNSMHEFRSGLGDNVEDMREYLDEMGYSELTGQPNHALAMLHYADHFQMRKDYVRSLTHCVGMHERLHMNSEYQHVPSSTKDLMHVLRGDMDAKLYSAAGMLRNFLDDELSETYLGLPHGARAHLDRFRGFLTAYYSASLGYYPPRNFDSDLLRIMREDFEALYELLVDNGYDRSESMPSIAVGGICTLQMVQNFDIAHGRETLAHPLPLLPYVPEKPKPRRMSWSPRADRTRPDSQLLSHTALIKATNWHESFFNNGLVRAYRRFEENSVLSKRADKPEKVSLVDARKVRWLLVYSVYQVLKSVTDEPAEVHEDLEASYHLAVSPNLLPQWPQKHELGFLLRTQSDMVQGCPSTGPSGAPSPIAEEEKIDIQPDVDYFALTHKQPVTAERDGMVQDVFTASRPLSRSNSLSRALSFTRHATVRRSRMLFKTTMTTSALPQAPNTSPRLGYHEIVVQGYGNGTNEVKTNGASQPATSVGSWASRSDSTASKSTSIIDSGSDTTDIAEENESPASSVDAESPTVEDMVNESVWDTAPTKLSTLTKRSETLPTMLSTGPNRRSSLQRSFSTMFDTNSDSMPRSLKSFPAPDSPTLTTSRSASFLQRTASLRLSELRRRSFVPGGSRRIAEDLDHLEIVTDERDEWASMQSWLDGDRDALTMKTERKKSDAWAQYAELGGLTETT